MADKTPDPETTGAAPSETSTPKGKKGAKPRTANYTELGGYGLKQASGFVQEEFLPELKGKSGPKFYREMSENSPIIGALLLGYRQVATHLEWQIEEPEEASAADIKATEFIKEAFEDMGQSWDSILTQALSQLTYGWALHEVVYKKRDDGRVGWEKFPIRAQETLVNWEFGPHGSIEAMVQADPVTGVQVKLPMEKCLLFRTSDMKNNPEGASMLRPAVVPYQYLRRIQEYEAIGVERDLAGLPVAWVPNEWMTSEDPKAKAALAQMIAMVQDVRNNERAGLVLPMMYEPDLTGAMSHNKMLDFELLASSGGRQFDTDKIITRYNQQVAMSLLGDFVTLGHDGVGSYALGAVKMDLWVMVVDSICKGITEVFNKYAIEKLLALNGITYDKPPVLAYGQVTNVDLAALVSYVKGLSDAGILTPDEGTETWLREQGGLPPLDPDVEPIYDRAPTNPLTGQPIDPNAPVDLKTGLPIDPMTHTAPALAKPTVDSATAAAANLANMQDTKPGEKKKPAAKPAAGKSQKG